MGQTDVTRWHLAGGKHAEILNVIDDHSRLLLASETYSTVKAQTSWIPSTKPSSCTAHPHRC